MVPGVATERGRAVPMSARGRCCRIQVRVVEASVDSSMVLDTSPWTSSSPIDGMFSRCGVCGQCTTQHYEWITPKLANSAGDAEPAQVLRRKSVGENAQRHRLGGEPKDRSSIYRRNSMSSSFSGEGQGGNNNKNATTPPRASWIPEKVDHVHGHVCGLKKSHHHHHGGGDGGRGGKRGKSRKDARGTPKHGRKMKDKDAVEDPRVQMRRRIAMVMRQVLSVLLAERRAGLDLGGSKSLLRDTQNRLKTKAKYLRLAATNKAARPQHRIMFARLDIHERAVLCPSSACHFLGRWHGDVGMRALTYSKQRYAEMREVGISFWPESLLMMIIEVYVLEKEPGVYLLHRGLGGSVAGATSGTKGGGEGGVASAGGALDSRFEVHGGGKVFSLTSDARGIRREARRLRDMVREQGWVEDEKAPTELDGRITGSSAGSAIEDGDEEEEEDDLKNGRRRGSVHGAAGSSSGSDGDSDDGRGIGCVGPGSEGSCGIS